MRQKQTLEACVREYLAGVMMSVALSSSACIEAPPASEGRDMGSSPDMSAEEVTAPCDVPAAGDGALFHGGEGTIEDPFVICSAEQLARIREEPAAHFVIERDLELDASWEPIPCLTGSLDGREHTISGLDVDHATYMEGEDYKVAGCVAAEAGPLQPKGGVISEVNGASISRLKFAAPEVDFAYKGAPEEIVIGGGLFGLVRDATLTDLHVEDLDARANYGFGTIAHGFIRSSAYGVYVYGESRILGALGDVGGVFGYIDGVGEQDTPELEHVYFVSESSPAIQVTSRSAPAADEIKEALTGWFRGAGLEPPGGLGRAGRIGGVAAALEGCAELSMILSHQALELPEELDEVGGIFGVVEGSDDPLCHGSVIGSSCEACAVEVTMTSTSGVSLGRDIGGVIGHVSGAQSFRLRSSYVEAVLIGGEAVGGVVGAARGGLIGLFMNGVIVDARADDAIELGCLVGTLEGSVERHRGSVSRIEITRPSACQARLMYPLGERVTRTSAPWRQGQKPRIEAIEDRLETLGISR